MLTSMEDKYTNTNALTFDEIGLTDLEGINNKKKIYKKLSLNLEYITERANSSMFVSKLLDDESKTLIIKSASFTTDKVDLNDAIKL